MNSITALSAIIACLFVATSAAPTANTHDHVVVSTGKPSADLETAIKEQMAFLKSLEKIIADLPNALLQFKPIPAKLGDSPIAPAVTQLVAQLEKLNLVPITDVIKAFDVQLNNLLKYVKENEHAINPVTSQAILEVVKKIREVIKSFQAYADILKNISSLAETLTKLPALNAEQAALIVKQINVLTGLVKELNDNCPVLLKFLTNANANLTKILNERVADVNKTLANIKSLLQEIITTPTKPTTDPISNILQTITAIIAALLETVLNIVGLQGDGGVLNLVLGPKGLVQAVLGPDGILGSLLGPNGILSALGGLGGGSSGGVSVGVSGGVSGGHHGGASGGTSCGASGGCGGGGNILTGLLGGLLG